MTDEPTLPDTEPTTPEPTAPEPAEPTAPETEEHVGIAKVVHEDGEGAQ